MKWCSDSPGDIWRSDNVGSLDNFLGSLMIKLSLWGLDRQQFLDEGLRLCWIKWWPELFGAAFNYGKPSEVLVGYSGGEFNIPLPRLRPRTHMCDVLPRTGEDFTWDTWPHYWVQQGYEITRWRLPARFVGKPLLHPGGQRPMTQAEVDAIAATDRSHDWMATFTVGNHVDEGWYVDTKGQRWINWPAGCPEKVIDLSKWRRPYGEGL